jgi:hypothetical protein
MPAGGVRIAAPGMTNQDRIAAILIQMAIRLIRKRDRADAGPVLQLDLAVVMKMLCIYDHVIG